MMDTVHDLYETQVKPLSVSERLELMQLIMQDLARSTARWTVEASGVWSLDDAQDLQQAAVAYSTASGTGRPTTGSWDTLTALIE